MKQKIVALLVLGGIFALFMLASCTSSSTAPAPDYEYGACSWAADSVEFEKGPPPVLILYTEDDRHVTWQYPVPVPERHITVVDFRWHEENCVVKQYESR